MYSAIADQLHLLGLSRDPSYHATRHAAANYLVENADAFMPFVASIHGEDMAGATDDGMMTPEGYREYCKRVEQSGDWGGEIEIQALSKYYNIPIHVIQHGPPHIISHTPVDEGSGPLTAEQAKMAGDKVVRISYHRRMYGLGEVSLASLKWVSVLTSNTDSITIRSGRKRKSKYRDIGSRRARATTDALARCVL